MTIAVAHEILTLLNYFIKSREKQIDHVVFCIENTFKKNQFISNFCYVNYREKYGDIQVRLNEFN